MQISFYKQYVHAVVSFLLVESIKHLNHMLAVMC